MHARKQKKHVMFCIVSTNGTTNPKIKKCNESEPRFVYSVFPMKHLDWCQIKVAKNNVI